jgi:hypothetical protein
MKLPLRTHHRPPASSRLRFSAVLCVYAMYAAGAALAAGEVQIEVRSDEAPVRYAAAQLRQALAVHGHRVDMQSPGQAVSPNFRIQLRTSGTAPAESYRIIRRAEGNVIGLEIEGGDARGTLYGAMALREALEQGRDLQSIEAQAASARFPFRAIKYNLPWYGYRSGEALALHDETCRDLVYWEAFLDMMVRNRFNALTLWSQHPFHLMIRNTRFPEACTLTDAELAEWQKFWRGLFALARERGIETYIVNWNIFVSPAFAAHHRVAPYSDEDLNAKWIGEGETAEIVKEYTRTTITQLIDTYPDLTGLDSAWASGWAA